MFKIGGRSWTNKKVNQFQKHQCKTKLPHFSTSVLWLKFLVVAYCLAGGWFCVWQVLSYELKKYGDETRANWVVLSHDRMQWTLKKISLEDGEGYWRRKDEPGSRVYVCMDSTYTSIGQSWQRLGLWAWVMCFPGCLFAYCFTSPTQKYCTQMQISPISALMTLEQTCRD